jgi:dihydrofolate reductase
MRITLIAAVARNGVIGREGRLPWRLPGDLQRFKAVTMGHPVIMGRKTWESIGRALPGRLNIVVSRTAGLAAAGCVVAGSLDEALRAAGSSPEVFVIGGAALYREVLPRADQLHLTRVIADFEGDVRFPEYDPADWRLVATKEYPADDRNPWACRVELFERNGPLAV